MVINNFFKRVFVKDFTKILFDLEYQHMAEHFELWKYQIISEIADKRLEKKIQLLNEP